MKTATTEEVREHLETFLDEAVEDDQRAIVHISREKVFPATPFVFLFVDNFERICDVHSLTAFEIRTVMKLIQKMQFGNQVSLTQAAIASEMNATRQQVNRVFKRLHSIGVMVDDEHGNTFINLELFMKGKFSNADREFKRQYNLSQRINRELKNPVTSPFDFNKKERKPTKQKAGTKVPAPAQAPQPELFDVDNQVEFDDAQ
jgi:hypothetical protein